jgi:hypothetical protein
MNIISRTRPQVKPTRVTPRSSAPFGFGLLRSIPSDRLPVPLSDLEWAEVVLNLDADDFDVIDEFAAAEAAAADALEAGLIPPDLGDYLARTSLVGLADEMTDAYADESERISGDRPSRDQAAAAVSLNWFRHSVGR